MEVKEQAERKIAQLHTRIQQLESQAHRLAGENAGLADRLAEAQGAVAAAAEAVDAADAAGSNGAAELAASRRARQDAEARCAQLEGELRKSKRREEKLQVGRRRLLAATWQQSAVMLYCRGATRAPRQCDFHLSAHSAPGGSTANPPERHVHIPYAPACLQALQYRLREDLKAGGGDPAAAAFDQLRDARGLEYELDRVANRAARDKQASRHLAWSTGAWMPCDGWRAGRRVGTAGSQPPCNTHAARPCELLHLRPHGCTVRAPDERSDDPPRPRRLGQLPRNCRAYLPATRAVCHPTRPQVLKEKLREALEANKSLQAELAAARHSKGGAALAAAAAAPLGVNKENAAR